MPSASHMSEARGEVVPSNTMLPHNTIVLDSNAPSGWIGFVGVTLNLMSLAAKSTGSLFTLSAPLSHKIEFDAALTIPAVINNQSFVAPL